MKSVEKNRLGHGCIGRRGFGGNTFPAVFEYHTAPFLEAVAVEGIGGVDDVEENVIEQVLERGN